MKTCSYCGKGNDDSAVACRECGTEIRISPEPSPQPAPPPLAPSPPALPRREWRWDDATVFRTIVVVSTLIYVVWFLLSYVEGRFVSRETADGLSWQGYGALLKVPDSILWLSFLLNIPIAIGLYSFSRAARSTFLVLLLFWWLIGLFQGLGVQTSFSGFLAYVVEIADGAILALAYLSPLKNRFADSPQD